MKAASYTIQVALATYLSQNLVSASCGFGGDIDTSFPTGLFSSSFRAPTSPTISTELSSSFIQHKYSSSVSHITSGYWYNSASAGKVRVDEAYSGTVASSLFDYTDIDQTGAVKNYLWSIDGSLGNPPSCFAEYVVLPGVPVLTADLLTSSNASFGGVVDDPWVGQAESWNLLYAGIIPVIACLQNTTVAVGYDFWSEFEQTKVFTRFFNIEIGAIDPNLFQNFPC